MLVNQIYTIVNSATSEVLGKTDIVAEDLRNIVDVGDQIVQASALDAYVKSLCNHIGKVIFVDRVYQGRAPKILMDAWEFGSICEKIQMDMPDATENESWELENGTSYDPNIFYKPSVSAKFFNKRVTFEVPMSFAEKQVKQSFSNVEQLNSFMSMLYNGIDKAMTVKLDALIMRTINNLIAETIYGEYQGANIADGSHTRAVNLLKLYNTMSGQTLTADKALHNIEFLKFATMTMNTYIDRLGVVSTLYNNGGKERFTSREVLNFLLLTDFKRAADTYLQSSVFHNEFTKLEGASTVPYWQGSGQDTTFNSVSKINVTTADNHTVNTSGIIGVMFDRDACGVSNMDRRVTSNYNPKAEFFTNWYKMDAGYFNDLNENCVVFLVA